MTRRPKRRDHARLRHWQRPALERPGRHAASKEAWSSDQLQESQYGPRASMHRIKTRTIGDDTDVATAAPKLGVREVCSLPPC